MFLQTISGSDYKLMVSQSCKDLMRQRLTLLLSLRLGSGMERRNAGRTVILRIARFITVRAGWATVSSP